MAKCQLETREKFWGSVQEIEDREAAVGPRPLSPFSEKCFGMNFIGLRSSSLTHHVWADIMSI
jgi:hypothetical protein